MAAQGELGTEDGSGFLKKPPSSSPRKHRIREAFALMHAETSNHTVSRMARLLELSEELCDFWHNAEKPKQ